MIRKQRKKKKKKKPKVITVLKLDWVAPLITDPRLHQLVKPLCPEKEEK